MNQYLVDFPKVTGNQLVKLRVPGSKSITNRALLLSALSDKCVTLRGALASEDALDLLQCLKDLGFDISMQEAGLDLDVTLQGCYGNIPSKDAVINIGSAGTVGRFMAAMLAFSDGCYILNASGQMKKRPVKPLMDSLVLAGAGVEYLEEDGHFPLKITGMFHDDPSYIPPADYRVDIEQSSQFLSALLLVLPKVAARLERPVKVTGFGTHGLSYIRQTAMMLQEFGFRIKRELPAPQEKEKPGICFVISPQKAESPAVYTIEPDMAAASYFYALAGILGITCEVEEIRLPSWQSDAGFLKVLAMMGCHIENSLPGSVRVTGPIGGRLKGGFTVDMREFSDQALTLAAMAPYADAPITITGIDHLRFQECDRIAAMETNLSAMGIQTQLEDRLQQDGTTCTAFTIFPGMPRSAQLKTFGDHRVAMAFALSGLKAKGITILDPECCKKTFAQYFEVLEDIKKQLTLPLHHQ